MERGESESHNQYKNNQELNKNEKNEGETLQYFEFDN